MLQNVTLVFTVWCSNIESTYEMAHDITFLTDALNNYGWGQVEMLCNGKKKSRNIFCSPPSNAQKMFEVMP